MSGKVKITRKDLKGPDEFISYTSKVYQWANENSKQLLLILLGLIVFVVAAVLVHNNDLKTESEASNLLYLGVQKMEEAQKINESTNKNKYEELKKEAISNFDKLINEYSGSKSMPFARFYKATIFYDDGSYDDAIKSYEKSLKSFGTKSKVAGVILTNIAYCYEMLGKTKESCEFFKRAADLDNVCEKDQIYFALGKCLKEAGEKAEAERFFRLIKSDYPDSKTISKVNEILSN